MNVQRPKLIMSELDTCFMVLFWRGMESTLGVVAAGSAGGWGIGGCMTGPGFGGKGCGID